MPFAFTEYGVAMISNLLRSKRAIQVNIQVMLAFSKIREMLPDSLSMKLDIEEIKRRLNSQDKNNCCKILFPSYVWTTDQLTGNIWQLN